jgi:adenylate cyclase
MDEKLLGELPAWLTEVGLAGAPETDTVTGFCDRSVAGGIPLGRAHLFLDTLHPLHEGRMFRWGYPNESLIYEYGRTSFEGLDATGAVSLDEQATGVWRRSPFHSMLQTGASLLRRRLAADTIDEFSLLPEWHAAGVTDYVAILTRFAPEGVIGEMDAVYSSWGTKAAAGFDTGHLAALARLAPPLALAIKSVSLVRVTRTLMETYLGRDAAQRVLRGRIVRGVAERIDAVVWFSDLRGFTHITDTEPEHVISLLNDYSDVIVSAIHGVAELNKRRSAEEKPVTEMYLGLHVGEVFYGNVGSRERLDFTVLGPAVNEASRIAAMCRSVEQPILLSAAFADVGAMKNRLVSVGRYALRGVSQPQELFTIDPGPTHRH